MAEPSLTQIMFKLAKHQDKNFVQRILQPERHPKLYDNVGGIAGKPSTHSMSWGTDENGTAWMYPTVVQGENGQLKRLDKKGAWDHARQYGEMIPFENPIEAAWYSKNYKRVWQR